MIIINYKQIKNYEILDIIRQNLNILPEFKDMNLKQYLHLTFPRGLRNDYKFDSLKSFIDFWNNFTTKHLVHNRNSNILFFVFKITPELILDLNIYNKDIDVVLQLDNMKKFVGERPIIDLSNYLSL
jgi:hypothetical protein